METERLIRPMRQEDISLLARWIAETPLWQRYQLTVPRIEISLERALEQNDLLLVADVTDEQAAGLAWCVLEGAFGRSPYLRLLGVHSPQQGLGAALLAALEQQMTGHEMFLLVSDFNINAQRFYQRQGYSQIGAIPGYVLPDVTELIYWKRLKKEG